MKWFIPTRISEHVLVHRNGDNDVLVTFWAQVGGEPEEDWPACQFHYSPRTDDDRTRTQRDQITDAVSDFIGRYWPEYQNANQRWAIAQQIIGRLLPKLAEGIARLSSSTPTT